MLKAKFETKIPPIATKYQQKNFSSGRILPILPHLIKYHLSRGTGGCGNSYDTYGSLGIFRNTRTLTLKSSLPLPL